MMVKTTPRILFIGTLPPPVHGSAVVSQQIKDSSIINESFRCDWVNLGTSRRMDEIGKRTLAKPFRFIGAWLRTLCLLIMHRYALCYLAITCHGIGFLKDAPFVLLCKLFGKKIVVHQHNKGMSRDYDKWPYKWLFPLCYNNTKVILLSWHLYPDIESIVSKDDVLICPNGISINEVGVDDTDHAIPNLLFLSNLIISKGVLDLLDALKLLSERGVSFRCDFVGGETKELDANRFAEEVNNRGLDGVVRYLGKKYGEEKETIWKQTDVFVFPTYYENETFGLVNLEAMAHRIPIVATNEGGIPDVVIDGENGYICEKKTPVSLAEKIYKLLKDKNLRKRMGDRGYEIFKHKYTLEKFEKRMRDILLANIN